ncbi:MAG: 3-oxoacyl-ACP reductase, partial [Pseudomonadota bacterium]
MARLAFVTAGTSAIGRTLVTGLAGVGYDVAFTHLGDAAAARLVCDQVAGIGGHDRRLGIEVEL